jgi:hypothetical protein
MQLRTKRITSKYAFENTEVVRLSLNAEYEKDQNLQVVDVVCDESTNEEKIDLNKAKHSLKRPRSEEFDASHEANDTKKISQTTDTPDLKTDKINEHPQISLKITHATQSPNSLLNMTSESIFCENYIENPIRDLTFETPGDVFTVEDNEVSEELPSVILKKPLSKNIESNDIECRFASDKSFDPDGVEIDPSSIKKLFHDVTGVDIENAKCRII